MRGEEAMRDTHRFDDLELPPHARRRVKRAVAIGLFVGITSACAEKRTQFLGSRNMRGNYLRMRGEETSPVRRL